MSHAQRRVLYCLAVLAVTTALAAQETSIQLPPDNPASQLKAGAGDDIVRRSCAICHSTDYIVRQPHLDAEHWDAEVKKMMATYGARISDSDERTIAAYLAKNYGVEAEPQRK